jgi:Beta-xylosidase
MTNMTSAKETVRVEADFAQAAAFPLVKKFGVYICTYVALERMLRDLELLHELKPCGVRYDPGWGFGNDDGPNSPREFNAPQISGTKDRLVFRFDEYDRLTGKLADEHVDIMYVHAYNPLPLQDPAKSAQADMNEHLQMRSNWNTMPVDMRAWERINYEYARRWKDKGWKVKYYEIWNEPDLQPVFFTGTKEQYFEIYKYGALGVKRADPEAKVGGPVLSSDLSWIGPFLDFVQKEGLPLDFFSYHWYGPAAKMVEDVRDILRRRPEMEGVEVILSEYNTYVPATPDFTTGGAIERYEAASFLLQEFKYFAEQPDIHSVYWAQYNDPEVFGEGVDRCGLIALDGRRKAAFNAFKIYADMPVERKRLTSHDDAIDGMAAAEDGRFCAVLWNRSDKEKTVELQLAGFALPQGRLKLYRIDADHASVFDRSKSDQLEVVEEIPLAGADACNWTGAIPAKGVVYAVVDDGAERTGRL